MHDISFAVEGTVDVHLKLSRMNSAAIEDGRVVVS